MKILWFFQIMSWKNKIIFMTNFFFNFVAPLSFTLCYELLKTGFVFVLPQKLSWGFTFKNLVPQFDRFWKIPDLIQLCLANLASHTQQEFRNRFGDLILLPWLNIK